MTTESRNGRAGTAPCDDRLAAFVADLRLLRKQAGQPSLRTMAQRGHYSHTALSGVLAGNRLPSQELTLAFVRACGGDEDAWRDRWQRENAALQPAAAPVDGRPVRWRARRGPVWVAAGVAVLAVVAAIAVVATVAVSAPWRQNSAAAPVSAPTASSAGAPGAVDGADPQEQRCQVDAVNAETVDVPDAGGRSTYGSLTLRYSPRCRAAWPLFVSTDLVPAGATIHLTTTRPSDGAVSEFDYPYLVHREAYSVFGNLLQTAQGCVSVAVEVRAAGDRRTLAAAGTPCRTPGSG